MIRTLIDILIQGNRNFPANKAFKIKPRYRSTVWSYSELYNFASGIAKLLEEKNIKKGSRVLLWAPNSPYWIGAFFGCLFKGIIVVPLHLQNTPRFICEIAKQTEAKLLLKSSGVEKPKALVCPAINIDYLDEFCQKKQQLKKTLVKEEDIVEILYTSGTTGYPKGVILTHKNIVSDLKAIFDIVEIKNSDRVLSILPLSHIFEQIVEFRTLSSGAQIVFVPALSSMIITRNLFENKITKMAVVPEFLKLVMQRIEAEARGQGKEKILLFLFGVSQIIPCFAVRRVLFRSLHKKFGGKLNLIISGAAPLEAAIGKKWQAMGINILQGYGLTETSPVVSVTPLSSQKLISVGKIVPGVQVKIAKDGEILVKGPIVTQGYWRDPEKTKKAFENQWLKTGDMGYFDEEKFLYIKGRKKFMILTAAGQNVYPEDIEFELNKEKGVEDSCVIPLEKKGRVEIHAVFLGKIKEPEKIVDKVNKRLASFQQIQSWSLWPFSDFPRTITRKAKRPEVLKYLSEKTVPEEIRLAKKKIPPLIEILSQITDTNPSLISKKTNVVKDLRLDSLMRIELAARIEEEFGVEIDEAKITPEITVDNLQTLIRKEPKRIIRHKLRSWPLHPLIKVVRALLQHIMLFPLLGVLAKIEIQGEENLKGVKSPLIIMPNHTSDLDAPILLKALPSLRSSLAAGAATDLLYEKFRYIEPLITLFFNTYPFTRIGQIKSGLINTGKLLDKDWSILVFPEGEASPTGELLPLKIGAGILGIEMRVPIMPVKILGTREIIPLAPKGFMVLHKHFPRKIRGKVIIKFGKPLYFKKGTSYDKATKIIERAIKEL